ncbi:MAG TPA: outer membrane protein assembly factor BamD [Terriglobales bacterium]|jgi:outer membrane protein assembly factor BamD|nr:outer membrane protein assembly factor BamD [Terriglobales bacterium]
MMRRNSVVVLLGLLLALTVACTNKKSNNPLANLGSKQPDKVLFDRAMDAMKHNKFDVARMTLQTLINTYPDSEFIARAKLAVADSWYAEGGTTAMQQAEIEYKDFKTFFPNMPEAAEAQLKVANIHYEEMEKPDRDFTHAMRAEEEYRALIQEYPDSKYVPKAKQRLREVQEVLADREFDIGRFYFMRMVYPAAIARLKTLVERYPLYSGADQALYLLGQSYEGQIEAVRKNTRLGEVFKGRAIDELTKDAAEAYAQIITRYPAMDRALDAKARLEALHQPVPRPTKAMLEQNKKEVASRHEPGTMANMLNGFEKHPDVAKASHVGEPTMTDPEPVTATKVVRDLAAAVGKPGGDSKLGVQTINGKVAPNQEAPRSDTPVATAADPATTPAEQTTAADPAATADLKANAADPNELKPNVEPDPTALPPLQQNNELESNAGTSSSASSAAPAKTEEMADISSSRKKKKKGLAKLNPF